jgi:hypothetical protein
MLWKNDFAAVQEQHRFNGRGTQQHRFKDPPILIQFLLGHGIRRTFSTASAMNGLIGRSSGTAGMVRIPVHGLNVRFPHPE